MTNTLHEQQLYCTADEPTNGLDSTTALRLMYTLRELASGGRAVVLAIHQPSYRLYSQLDHLLLMSEGHAIYYGAFFSLCHEVLLHQCNKVELTFKHALASTASLSWVPNILFLAKCPA